MNGLHFLKNVQIFPILYSMILNETDDNSKIEKQYDLGHRLA